jgi:hypothetical protein
MLSTAASQRRADHVVATEAGESQLLLLHRPPALGRCSGAADPSSSMSLEALCLRGWQQQAEEAQRMGLVAGPVRLASEQGGIIGGDSTHSSILVRPGDAWQQGAEGRTVVDRSQDRLRLVGSLRGLLRILDDDDDEVDEAGITGVRACTYEATDEAGGGGGAFNLCRPSDCAATTEGLMAKQ